MDGEYELEREGEIRQARQFPRALLRDFRLSFSARGLFAFLWDLPTGWRIRASHLSSCGPQRRDAIRTILRELVAVKAIRIERVRGEKGRLSGTKWILRSPHLWAIEAPLRKADAPKPASSHESTEERETRPSGSQTFGNAPTKVLTNYKFSSSFDLVNGIAVWNSKDREAADQILADFGVDKVALAVEHINSQNKDPLPGRVRRHIVSVVRAEKNKAAADRKKSEVDRVDRENFKIDSEAQEKGEALIRRIRSKMERDES